MFPGIDQTFNHSSHILIGLRLRIILDHQILLGFIPSRRVCLESVSCWSPKLCPVFNSSWWFQVLLKNSEDLYFSVHFVQCASSVPEHDATTFILNMCYSDPLYCWLLSSSSDHTTFLQKAFVVFSTTNLYCLIYFLPCMHHFDPVLITVGLHWYCLYGYLCWFQKKKCTKFFFVN